MIGYAVLGLAAFAVGFGWGRLEEWRRVLAYLHAYEDDDPAKPLWWLAAGIAADVHWNRRGRYAREDAHVS